MHKYLVAMLKVKLSLANWSVVPIWKQPEILMKGHVQLILEL